MLSGRGDVERLLTIAEVCRITSLSRSTVYRLSRGGLFPRPVHLTTNRSAFVQSELAQWIAERTARAGDRRRLSIAADKGSRPAGSRAIEIPPTVSGPPDGRSDRARRAWQSG